MKKNDIVVGGHYWAKVNGQVVTVRVDAIREGGFTRGGSQTAYDVTNLTTGRRTTFRSAAKFRSKAGDKKRPDPTIATPRKDGTTAATSPPTLREEQEAGEAANGMPDTLPGEGEDCPDPTSPSTIKSSGQKSTSLPSGSSVGESISALTTTTFTAHAKNASGSPKNNSAPSGLAAKLASRTPALDQPLPELVAGMRPTEEQQSILEAARQSGLKVLVINAGAGAGKTSTLKMLEQVLPGVGQYTAFNASLVNESKAKFTKCGVNTTHSLAFRAVGRQYAHRLGGSRVRSDEIARRLGIEAVTVETGSTKQDGKPVTKILQAGFLAGQVMAAVRKFCQSEDRAVSEEHFKYIDGIDQPTETADGKSHRTYANNDKVKEYLIPFAAKAWKDLADPQGTLPFNHDVYVKVWELGQGKDKPHIAANYILLDEHQDTAEVFVSILKQQNHALVILVGDDCQRIYEWRGAINAGEAFPGAPRKLLSQSFRFGQAIADVANTILATLQEPTDLVLRGLESIPSRVAPLTNPDCVLCRTNARAVATLLGAVRPLDPLAIPKRVHLIGGGDETVKFVKAAVELQDGRRTQHPELCCFESWQEVQEYSKTDEGDDLRLMVKLIDEFEPQPILDALERMPSEKDADLVISTAHKSKGREWGTVKLASDFPTKDKMSDPDRRLLYVAATRAKYQLDISECPPFCGGQSGRDTGDEEDGGWVPGLQVKYTTPMPNKEELEAYLEAKEQKDVAQLRLNPRTTPPLGEIAEPYTLKSLPANPEAVPATLKPAAPNGKKDEFSWANWDGNWCVGGPAGRVGETVTVTRRNGTSSTVKLLAVVKAWPDRTIYRV